MFKIKMHVLFFTAAIVFIVLASPGPGTLAFEKADRDEITALYLYNFLLFVEWPASAFNDKDCVCTAILGDDLLFEALKPMNGKTIKGRKMIVERCEDLKDLERPFHVIFIGSSVKALVPQILEQIKDEPVLTVSDMEGFTQMGGMVFFRNIGDPSDKTEYPKRFEINLPAVKRAGLKIRSRLLRLSDIVNNP